MVAKPSMPLQSPAPAYRGAISALSERQSAFSRSLVDCRPYEWSSVIATARCCNKSPVVITEDHFHGLQSAKGLLKPLCLSTCAESTPRYAAAGLCIGIGALATITSLVRLHLSVMNQNPDWQPLAQLPGLQDLALQCHVFLCSVCLGHCSKVYHALASCVSGVNVSCVLSGCSCGAGYLSWRAACLAHI